MPLVHKALLVILDLKVLLALLVHRVCRATLVPLVQLALLVLQDRRGSKVFKAFRVIQARRVLLVLRVPLARKV